MKKGISTGVFLIGIIAVGLLTAGVFYMGTTAGGPAAQQATGAQDGEGAAEGPAVIDKTVSCGIDTQPTLTVKMRNSENNSREYTNASFFLLKKVATEDGGAGWSYVGEYTAGDSAGKDISVVCGATYKVRKKSTSSELSYIDSVTGEGKLVDEGEAAEIKIDSSSHTLKIQSPQKATLEYQAYDKRGVTQYENDDGNTDYATEPVSFYSSYTDSNTSTAIDVGSGEYLRAKIWVRAQENDALFHSLEGAIIGLNANSDAAANWNTNDAWIQRDGQSLEKLSLSDLKGTEQEGFRNSEEFWKLTNPIDDSGETVFDFKVPAKEGVNPDDSIVWKIGLRGNYLSNEEEAIYKATHKDDQPTYSSVYNVEDITFEVA